MTPCRECGTLVAWVDAGPDPRTAQRVYQLRPCGHHTDPDTVLGYGVDVRVTPTNGATLAAAERLRQITEEGFTPEHDAEHPAGELAWAAWCLLDRVAGGGPADPTQPPTMWPWDAAAWKPEKSPMRLLIIVAAMLHAELDRRLTAGETP